LGIDRDGLPDQIRGRVVAADLVGDKSKMMQRNRISGLGGQNLSIKPLGLLQSPGLMMLDGLIEGLLDRELGHERRILAVYPNCI
jgi:hypothetical protein